MAAELTPQSIADILGLPQEARYCDGSHVLGGCIWERVMALSYSIEGAVFASRKSALEEAAKVAEEMPYNINQQTGSGLKHQIAAQIRRLGGEG